LLEFLVGAKVEPGEGKLLALSWLESFCMGLPRAFTFQGATILWLQHVDPGLLPWAYAATALVIPAIGALTLSAQRRVSLEKLLLGGYALTAALAGCVFLTTVVASHQVSSFVVRTWYEAELALTGFLFWRGANRLFTAQQAKRLFPFVGTGEVVAFILAGVVAPPLIGRFGAASLLLLSVLGTFAAMILQLVQQRRRVESGASRSLEGSEAAPDVSIGSVLRQRYPMLVASMYAVPAFCVYFLIDGVWMGELDVYFSDGDQVSEFVGNFSLVLGFAVLGAKRLMAPRVLDLFGVRGGLIIPALTQVAFLGVLTWMVLGGAGAEATVICAIAMKFFERVNVQALHYPAYYILYQPMTAAEATRVQTVGETILSPALGLVVSLALVPLTRVQLVVVCLAGTLFYTLVAHRVGAGFRAALLAALRRGVVGDTDLDVQDASTRRGLEAGLAGGDTREAIYCLRTLVNSDERERAQLLLEALTHEDGGVRAEAFGLIEAHPDGLTFPPVLEALQVETDPGAQLEAIGAVAAVGSVEAAPVLQELLDSGDETTQAAAMAALMRYCGLEAIVRSGTRLLALTASESEADRILAAKVLEKTRTRELCVGLEELLEDPSDAVRRAAISAASVLDNPRLWPAVIRNLGRPATRADAIRGLSEGTDGVISALERAFVEDEEHGLGSVIVQVVSRVQADGAEAFLLGRLTDSEPILRQAILRGLSVRDYRCALSEEEEVRAVLDEEVGRLSLVVKTCETLGRCQESEALRSALEESFLRIRKRILLLLALLYPREEIQRVADHLELGGEGRVDLAVELLGVTLAARDRGFIPELVTDLAHRVEVRDEEPRERLREVVEKLEGHAGQWSGRWLRACVADLASHLNEGDGAQASLNMQRVLLARGAEIFGKIDGERLCDVVEVMDEKCFAQGQIIIEEGDTGSELYLVVAGAVAVERPDQEPVELGEGSVFGEWAALVPEPRAATVRATVETSVLTLERDDLRALMEIHPDLTRGIIDVLCGRLRLMNEDPVVSRRGTPRPEDLTPPECFELELSGLEKVLGLGAMSIFGNLGDASLRVLGTRSTSTFVSSGSVLFERGELATSAYRIESGRLGLEIPGEATRVVEAGDVIDELAALSSRERIADVVALEDSLLLRVGRHAVYESIEGSPEFSDSIIRTLVARLRASC
jgi:CRP-like cAMP-binding protein/HEAT repeat protein